MPESPEKIEARFKHMADFAPVLLWMSRTDGFCTYFNQSWLEFTGRSLEQEWGVGWAEGVHAEDFQLCMDTYVDAFSKRESFEMEYRLRRHDGEYRWILDRGKPRYEENGDFAGYIGSCVDISEIKQAKDLAIQASELKTNFLANMSHEIRTPLNSIIGVVELLMESKLNPDQLEYVGLVDRAGKTLMSLINDILDFSKIESGRLELDCEAFNLQEVIETVSGVIQVKAQQKNLIFKVNIDKKIPPWLNGDFGKLTQVLTNLLGNAVKFTSQGKILLEVLPSAALQASGLRQTALSFSVSDHGIGIPKDKLPSLFERFSQADASTTRRYGGSGLGLAITHKLVEMMGGSIEVHSQVGTGSTFTVHLPFKIASAEKAEPAFALTDSAPLEQRSGKKLKILLVEDYDENRKVIAALLKNAPYCIEIAENGQIALELFKKQKPDLVLMDMQMPVMDGYTATREMRAYEKMHDLKETPVVALSANAMRADQKKSMAAGCNDYLTKPILKKKLLSVIAKNLKENTGDH